MAVLFRSAFQMIELELELNKRNIPLCRAWRHTVFEQAHIKDDQLLGGFKYQR